MPTPVAVSRCGRTRRIEIVERCVPRPMSPLSSKRRCKSTPTVMRPGRGRLSLTNQICAGHLLDLVGVVGLADVSDRRRTASSDCFCFDRHYLRRPAHYILVTIRRQFPLSIDFAAIVVPRIRLNRANISVRRRRKRRVKVIHRSRTCGGPWARTGQAPGRGRILFGPLTA